MQLIMEWSRCGLADDRGWDGGGDWGPARLCLRAGDLAT